MSNMNIEKTIQINHDDFSVDSLINMLREKNLSKQEKTTIESLIGVTRFELERDSIYEKLSKKNITLYDSMKIELFVDNFDDISMDKFEEFIKKDNILEHGNSEQKNNHDNSMEFQNEILKLKNKVFELKKKLTTINTISSSTSENIFN